MDVQNKKLDLEELFIRRKEVLARWPTGNEIDLEEAIEYRKAIPRSRQMVYALADAAKEGRALVAAHIGHAGVEETMEHCQAVAAIGAGYSNIAPDAYTRRGRYREAEKAVQASMAQGKSLLNGYPMVIHGLKNARKLNESVNIPLMIVDAVQERTELTTEIGLAAGFWRSSCDVSAVLMASKDYPIDVKIREAQYKNRLTGYYEERGVPVQVQVTALFCGHDPPGIKVAMLVLHSLLAAEQGIKHIGLSPYLTAHLIQDVAMLRLSREMVQEYLKKFGYDIVVSVGATQFAGPYPSDEMKILSILPLLYATPILAGANFFHIKSPYQAIGIPDKDENVKAIKICNTVMEFLGKQRYDEGEEFKIEKEMIRLEAEAIISKTLELGDGDAAVGQIKAVEAGVIDVPYSPYPKVKDLAYPLRDDTGAIRWFKHGNIPLPKEVIEYHQESIARRLSGNNDSVIDLMISDLNYVCR
ncbi:hypothetical protein ACFLXL_03330 [Chloroflexota bacterium]